MKLPENYSDLESRVVFQKFEETLKNQLEDVSVHERKPYEGVAKRVGNLVLGGRAYDNYDGRLEARLSIEKMPLNIVKYTLQAAPREILKVKYHSDTNPGFTDTTDPLPEITYLEEENVFKPENLRLYIPEGTQVNKLFGNLYSYLRRGEVEVRDVGTKKPNLRLEVEHRSSITSDNIKNPNLKDMDDVSNHLKNIGTHYSSLYKN